MDTRTTLFLTAALALTLAPERAAWAATPQPLKVMLIAGGCCHDYATQKDLLKKGIEARANAVVDIVFIDDDSTRPKLPILGSPTMRRAMMS